MWYLLALVGFVAGLVYWRYRPKASKPDVTAQLGSGGGEERK